MPRKKDDRAGRKNPAKLKKKDRRRLHVKWVLPVLLIGIVLAFFAWMAIQANFVHLRSAVVYLPDLPAQFDGVEMLYVSDLNIRNRADAAASRRLMKKLAQLEPDLLLLGGDYSAMGLMDAVNGRPGAGEEEAMKFIRTLNDFPAPMGKFAVDGEHDSNPDQLDAAFEAVGVQFLSDRCVEVEKGGEKLFIAGLSDVSRDQTPYDQIGRYFSGDECVVALAHNPSAYIGVRVAEARGGGAWADLVLAGHNLGGQMKIFGRTLHEMPDEERRCLAGWYYVGDLPMLVSQGVGCEGLKLRLNTQSEAWLLTLKRPMEQRNKVVLPDLSF